MNRPGMSINFKYPYLGGGGGGGGRQRDWGGEGGGHNLDYLLTPYKEHIYHQHHTQITATLGLISRSHSRITYKSFTFYGPVS